MNTVGKITFNRCPSCGFDCQVDLVELKTWLEKKLEEFEGDPEFDRECQILEDEEIIADLESAGITPEKVWNRYNELMERLDREARALPRLKPTGPILPGPQSRHEEQNQEALDTSQAVDTAEQGV